MGKHRAGARSALIVAAILILAMAGVAVASYNADRRPAEPRSDVSGRVWLGPKGSGLQKATDERLRRALAALNGSAPDSLSDYRTELRAAKALLQRAVLANLADTRAIQRLAAVDWELGVLDGSLDGAGLVGLVAIGGARSPRVPGIQAELGDVLYKLGRPDDAQAYMFRAVSLSPAVAYRVVTIMLDAGVEPSRIVTALPHAPEVLTALIPVFVSRGHGEELLAMIEDRLAASPSRLLAAYGDLALGLGRADRLQAHLVELGSLADLRDEAERQFQLGRASAAQGAHDAAYQYAMRAVSLGPSDPRYCEFAGLAALETNHFSEGETLLREGISSLAMVDGSGRWRARLYRQLGELYERKGQGDEALVCFRRALLLDPDEAVAKSKVARIDALLGGKPDPRP